MKKLIFSIILSVIISPLIVVAAPSLTNYSRTLLPETTSSYELGTSTRTWLNIFTDSLCLGGDCRTSWPAGGPGGSGNVSTSTNETAGAFAVWTTNGATPAKLGATTSPTVGYLTATSSSATSTFAGGLQLTDTVHGLNVMSGPNGLPYVRINKRVAGDGLVNSISPPDSGLLTIYGAANGDRLDITHYAYGANIAFHNTSQQLEFHGWNGSFYEPILTLIAGSTNTLLQLRNPEDTNSISFNYPSGNGTPYIYTEQPGTDLQIRPAGNLYLTPLQKVSVSSAAPQAYLYVSTTSAPITGGANTTNGSAVATSTNNVFTNVVVGDAIKVCDSTYRLVTVKTSSNQVTLASSVGATCQGGSGTVTYSPRPFTAENDNLQGALTVAGNGSIGLGTIAPKAPLHLNNNGSGSEAERITTTYDTSNSSRAGITWSDTSAITGQIDTSYDGSKVSMNFGSLYNGAGAGYNSQKIMTITGTGNVGIGTTSPYATLSAVGQVVGAYYTATTTSTSTLPRLTGSLVSGFGLSSCVGSSNKVTWDAGTFRCEADQAGAPGGGITSLNAQYSAAQTGSAQTFATSSDTNLQLTITSSGDIHTFTPVWAGTLAVSRGGTGQSTFTSGQLLYGNGTNGLSSIATTTATCSGATSCTTHVIIGSSPVTISSTDNTASTTLLGDNNTFTGTNVINLSRISNLTSNGFVKTSGTNGTLSIDTNTYLTGNQSITLSGDVSGSGATAITTAIGNNKVTVGMLAQAAAGTVLGNPTGSTANIQAVSTSTLYGVGTNGFVLAEVGGIPTWTATTTFNSPLTYSNGAVSCSTCLTAALTAIGPVNNTTSGPTVTLATSSTAYNGLTSSTTITTSGSTITFANTLAGTLGVGAGGTGLTATPTFGQILRGTGTGYALVATSTLGIAISDTTGTLAIARGGTNNTSYNNGEVVYYNGTGLVGTSTANLKTTLSLNNVENTALSTWTGSSNIATVGTITSGTWNGTLIAPQYGGTGWASLQAGTVLIGNGTTRLATTSAGTNGQVLALVGGTPTWVATTTAGTGLTYNGSAFTVNTSQNISTLSNLTSNGAVLTSGGTGALSIYAGTSCTNQFVRSLNGSISATCATVGAADVSLANLTATDSTLTFSGTYNGSSAQTIGLNLGNANTWTGKQTFTNASSTYFSSGYSSSTSLVAGSARVTGLTNCDTIDTDANGNMVCGTDATGAGGLSGGTAGMLSSWVNGTTLTATSAPTAAYYVATSTTASTFPYASTTMISATTASTSALVIGVGSESAPSIAFTGTTGLGIYKSGINQLAFTSQSTIQGYFDGVQFVSNVPFVSVNGGGFYIKSAAGAESTPTYTFQNDADTGMYSDTANELAFSTGAIQKMIIKSNGFVGIGTSSPYAKLSVAGPVVGQYFTATSSTASVFPYASTTGITASYASSTLYFGAGLQTCDPTTGKITWASGVFGCGTDQTGGGGVTGGTAGMLSAWVNSTTLTATSGPTAAYFTATSSTATSTFAGKVGIGTTSPMGLSKLTVVGNEDHWSNYYHFGLSGNTDSVYCNTGSQCFTYAGSDDTTLGTSIEVQNISAGTHAYAALALCNNLCDSSGLHYFGTFLSGSNYNDTTFGTALAASNQLQISNTDGIITLASQSAVAASSTINFVLGGTSVANEIMRITPRGAVGIGTTTPRWPLTISSSTAPQLVLTDGSLTSSQWAFRNNGGVLDIGTSSPSTFATSSPAILELNGSNASSTLSIGTTTASGVLNLGTFTANGTTTIVMGRVQFDGYNTAGVRTCTYLNGSNNFVTETTACKQP